MPGELVSILLVEDNQGDAELIRELLNDCERITYKITHAETLSSALQYLSNQTFHAVLLDLGLTDSQGLATLQSLGSYRKQIPITVITGLNDERIGEQAIEMGAQSYIEKNNLDSRHLSTSIYFSIERHKQLMRAWSSEELLRSFMNGAADGFLLLNKQFRITMINRAGLEYLRAREQEVIGLHIEELFPNFKKTERFDKYLEVMNSGTSYTFDQVQLPELGNKHFTIKAFKVVNGLGIIVDDISDRIKKENQLREANTAKDKIVSVIAHDLRSPFNSILGFLDELYLEYNNLTDQERRKYISILYQTSNNTFDLLENLLAWSRSETNRISKNPEDLALRETVFNAVSHLKIGAERKEITITNAIPEDIIVRADWYMVTIILRNLLSNAIKFTNEQGSITFGNAKGTPDMETLYVRDTGIGIPENKIPSLLKKENSNTTKGTANEEGTGLGLNICREFVELHGGKLWLESEPGKGSTFWFTLPKGGSDATKTTTQKTDNHE